MEINRTLYNQLVEYLNPYKVNVITDIRRVGKTINAFFEYELLVIDEAQAIPEIEKKLNLIVDHVKGLRVIATGSSALDLAQQSGNR